MYGSKSPITVLLYGVLLYAPVSAQVTQRASVATGGAQGNQFSGEYGVSISADGRYVTFQSRASNLVSGDTNGTYDVFVRDRQTGTTERVSVDSGGVEGNGECHAPSISADGRYVAFASAATNLVPGDTNGFFDIFVRDRQSGTTERVSVDSGGVQGNGDSGSYVGQPLLMSISSDGRYVAFASVATNLASGVTGGIQLYVRDRQGGTTELVSVNPGGALQGNGNSYSPSISADGRYVAFHSDASNLVSGDTNSLFDVFVRDRQSSTTERVSVATGGAQGLSLSSNPGISADGRYVAFTSQASFVAGDTNGFSDVYVRDRQLATTDRVSVATGGAQGNQGCGIPSISADGRYVAFQSFASNLVSGDTNGTYDVFVCDRLNDTTERVSIDSGGVQGNNASSFSSISADGRFVAFTSLATNLVAGDTNGAADVFVRDRDATAFTSLCDPGVGGVIGCPCSNPPSGLGRGCDNFGAGPLDSGTLTATGVAYLQSDTVVLTATGENNSSLTVFWTGKGPPSSTGVAHGAGVRCVTQALRRMYTHSAAGGTVSAPVGADLSVSARTAQVYASVPIAPGETRYYFNIYRDPLAAGPCGNPASTVNLTNAGAIAWSL